MSAVALVRKSPGGQGYLWIGSAPAPPRCGRSGRPRGGRSGCRGPSWPPSGRWGRRAAGQSPE
jgi:hypothetical protein